MQDRRNYMGLDDACHYCRQLEADMEPPTLHKLCNAITTVDRALASGSGALGIQNLSPRAWHQVRDSLFNQLLSRFAGYFLIYEGESVVPLDTGSAWPDSGTVEFYPELANRKTDSYMGRLEDLNPDVLLRLRWSFAEGRHQISPTDFDAPPSPPVGNAEPAHAGQALLARLYEVCEEEAARGKKKAHRKWWQLYWEASSCLDRRARCQLQKQMIELQFIWGRPA